MSPQSPVRVALDAMGGDRGPEVNVEGAVSASRELGTAVILVGNETVLQEQLRRHDATRLPITIRHAPEVVGMEEGPVLALRRKKRSSVRIGLDMVHQGEAEGFVSAGNTGAVMATALMVLGALPGVERPAIAAVMPTVTGRVVMLDVGANVDCKARHLLQFAIMGHVYAQDILELPAFQEGKLHTGFLKEHLSDWQPRQTMLEPALIASALYRKGRGRAKAGLSSPSGRDGHNPWATVGNWGR